MFQAQPVFLQNPDRPMSHCGFLASLLDGTLQTVWFSGKYETAEDMVILTSRKKNSDKDWSKPEILVTYPGYGVGQPVLFLHRDGSLWLLFVVIMNKKDNKTSTDHPYNALPPRDGWIAAQPFIQKSLDQGRTWETPEQIMNFPGLMFRGRPLIVQKRIIIPAYDENTWESIMLISDDEGQSWRLSEAIQTSNGNIHACLIQKSNGRIIAYLRPGGTGGVLWRTLSLDYGDTWETPIQTQIPNPNSGFDLIRLHSGNILLAFNDSTSKRTPLCIALVVEDECLINRCIIESGPGEFSYPSLIQTKDHRIHMVYTYHRRHINCATFSEEWIYSKFDRRIKL